MSKFLIVSASSDIGQNTAVKLKEKGHNVITTARDDKIINPDYILDPSNFEEVDKVFAEHADIDGVVNCSGSLFLKPAHSTSQNDFENVIKASLTTSFAIVRAAGKYMKNGGSVVLISTAASISGFANHEAIAAAKGGVNGLVLSAAATYASNNLRFNAVAPGLVDTKLTSMLLASDASRKISESMHALGRVGKVYDISNMIMFLLDQENSWITGQIIAVDGGLSKVRPKLRA